MDANDLTEEQAKRILESNYFLGELLPEDIEFVDATRFTDGYAAVNLGKAWIFIDKQLIPRGNNENPIYEDALPFSNGLAGIKLNGKYGYINTEFNIVIPCKYDSCAIAGKNLCCVYGGRQTEDGYSIMSYIDRSGKVIWQNMNEGNYWKNKSGKTSHDWREFKYTYIGKNYLPLVIIITIVAIIAVVFIVSRRYKKKSALKKKKNGTSADKIDNDKLEKSSDTPTPMSKQKVTHESQLLSKKDNIRNNLDKSNNTAMPSVDERLDDILNL